MKLIAKTLMGLEEILAQELRDLKAKNVEILNRAVSFEGDMKMVYKANLHCRTAMSILNPIFSFHAKHPDHLYKKIKAFDWEQVLGLKDTFAIKSTVHSEYFTHSYYIALKMKDGIADHFTEKYDRRPDVNRVAPKILLQLHISDSKCTVLRDSSGDPLYKRGYRLHTVNAPMNEVLAAGLIKLSGWDPSTPLLDPMCGSGTIPLEAALLARNIPSNIMREKYAFMKWKDYNEEEWLKVKEEAIANINDQEVDIYASDKEMGAIRKAEFNYDEIPYLKDAVSFLRSNFLKLDRPTDEGTLIFNPPYDERMKVEEIQELYKKIGDHLKKEFTNYKAWIISSNKEAIKHIGLRTSKKLTVFNGKLECKFLNYDLYAGSKKSKYENTLEE